MVSMPESDSLQVSFQHELLGDGLRSAIAVLQKFGSIACVQLVPGDARSVAVSFYDIRAAALAHQALGDRCSCLPQHGNRFVCLPGAVELDPSQANEVAGIWTTEDGTSDEFVVAFYDARTAAAVAELTSAQRTAPPVSRALSTPMRLSCDLRWEAGAAERGILASHGPRAPDELAGSEKTIQLRGLPRQLCAPGVLQRLLDQHGLRTSVTGLRAFCREGKRLGFAFIEARSTKDLQLLAKFFHGRQFGASMPVSVGIVGASTRSSRTDSGDTLPICVSGAVRAS